MTNKLQYILLALLAALTLLPQQVLLLAQKCIPYLQTAGNSQLIFFFYTFFALVVVLFMALLIKKDSSYKDKLGLTLPWKEFTPGWAIVICLLWIVPNTLSGNWIVPSPSLYLFVAVVMAPLTEELIFRGFIQSLLPKTILWKWAKLDTGVVIMSVFFALWHFNILHPSSILLIPFLLHFMGGITLGMLRNQTGAIWLGVLAHALGNLTAQMHILN